MRRLFLGHELSHFEIGQNQCAGDNHAGQGADRVECLGQVEATGSGCLGPHGKNVGIGAGFQKGQAKCQNVEANKKDIELLETGGGDGQQSSRRVEGQSNQNPPLERYLPDNQGCGNRHGRISAVKGPLNE